MIFYSIVDKLNFVTIKYLIHNKINVKIIIIFTINWVKLKSRFWYFSIKSLSTKSSRGKSTNHKVMSHNPSSLPTTMLEWIWSPPKHTQTCNSPHEFRFIGKRVNKWISYFIPLDWRTRERANTPFK